MQETIRLGVNSKANYMFSICWCFKCNYFVCKKGSIVVEESNNSQSFFAVYKMQTEVKGSLHEETELKIKNAVGLRHVIDLLSSEKKLIVGHNCFLGTKYLLQDVIKIFFFKKKSPEGYSSFTHYLLIFLHDTDLAHLYSKFIAPLPSTGEDYISSIAKHFPHIIDTKLLLNNNDVFQVMKRKRSTSLAKAFAFLCPEIVSGVKTHRTAYKPCVKVEVQVDDTRFTFLCIYYFCVFFLVLFAFVHLLLQAVFFTSGWACSCCSNWFHCYLVLHTQYLTGRKLEFCLVTCYC